MNAARDEGAVGREDTCPPSPGSDEHAEEIEEDKANRKLVDCGDDAQTTAKFLAVSVTVIDDIKICLKRIEEHTLVFEIKGSISEWYWCCHAHTPVFVAIAISRVGWNTAIRWRENTCVPAITINVFEIHIVKMSIKWATKEIIGLEASSSIKIHY